MTNPEKSVLDDIDELIASECDEHGVPLDDHNRDRYLKCELCHEDWHGKTNFMGCPGAYATEEQVKAWDATTKPKQPYIGYLTTEYEGVLCTVHLYADGRGGYIGLLSPGVEDNERGLSSDLYTFDEAHATLSLHPVVEGVVLPIMQVPQLISESDTP
jgi:hypothetical protein